MSDTDSATDGLAAGAIARPSVPTIGVIFDAAHSSAFDIVDALHPSARNAGARLIPRPVRHDRDEIAAIAELRERGCDALVVVSPRSTSHDIRVALGDSLAVVVGRPMPDSAVDVVRSRGEEGVEAVVRHLAELGHHDIAFVHSEGIPDAEERLAGYLRAATALELNERIVDVHDADPENSGATAAWLFLQDPRMPTAIVCNDDQAALGLAHRLLEAGLRIPRDVSVTGFDDGRIARLSILDLTTVHQDPQEIAIAALAAVLSRINGATPAARDILTSATLVIRGSTGAPAPR